MERKTGNWMDFVDGKVAPVFLLNEQSVSHCLPSRKKKKNLLYTEEKGKTEAARRNDPIGSPKIEKKWRAGNY